MVMSRAPRLAAIGVVVGLIAAGVFTRALEQLLFRAASARSGGRLWRATGAVPGRRDCGGLSRRAGACARHPARCCAPDSKPMTSRLVRNSHQLLFRFQLARDERLDHLARPIGLRPGFRDPLVLAAFEQVIVDRAAAA